MKPSLILGSSSKRRLEILSSLNIDFKHHPTPFDEESYIWPANPREGVQEMARLKAQALVPSFTHDRLLTADTIVLLEGKILGKPKNQDQARDFLHRLQGKQHEVLSGVCVFYEGLYHVGVESTFVNFASLSSLQIEKYILSTIPYDKAGGYAIQGGVGSLLVQSIEGSYDTVVGLPLGLVYKLLLKTGYDLWQNLTF
jgi:septum formation protein